MFWVRKGLEYFDYIWFYIKFILVIDKYYMNNNDLLF